MSLAEKLKQERRIILGNVDIDWMLSRWEELTFQMMWRDGASALEIADALERPILEVGLLIIEQGEVGSIRQRKKGLRGGEQS